MDHITYLEKLKIGFADKDKQFIFLNKVHNSLMNNYFIQFSHQMECAYASYLGLPFSPDFDILDHRLEGLERAWKYIIKYPSFEAKLAAVVDLANLLKRIKAIQGHKYVFDSIIDSLETSHLQYDLLEDEDGCYVFPKGDVLLDSKEIMEPLELLKDYPDAERSFSSALRNVSNLDDSNASEVADSLRKALECFFQKFFNSEKTLENLKSQYGRYLKEKGISGGLAGNLESLLQAYTNYNNNHAKHKDKASQLIIEYLLYETGNIIRLLISLKKLNSNK